MAVGSSAAIMMLRPAALVRRRFRLSLMIVARNDTFIVLPHSQKFVDLSLL